MAKRRALTSTARQHGRDTWVWQHRTPRCGADSVLNRAFVRQLDATVFVHRLQVYCESPQAREVLQHLVGVATEWFAAIAGVPQGEGAISPAFDVVDLNIGFAAA